MVRLWAPSESPDPLGKPFGLGASVYLRGGWWLWSVTCLGARTQLTSICTISQGRRSAEGCLVKRCLG